MAKDKNAFYAEMMIHLNGNLLCVFDVETTGLDFRQHEIIQITCLPLDAKLNPHDGITPFDMKLKPLNLDSVSQEALKISRTKLVDACNNGVDPQIGATLFDEWYDGLNLPFGKRISPLAHNWPFDRDFIRDWQGDINFNQKVDGRYRDTQAIGLFVNDIAWDRQEQFPYPKYTLKYMCAMAKIEWDDGCAHDSLYDCMKTAELYRVLMKKHGHPGFLCVS